MNRALFIDLDHTLIRPKSGNTFPQSADDWEFMPGMVGRLMGEADRYGPLALNLVIVTNQGGVLAGFHTQQEVEQKLATVCRELGNIIKCPVFCYAAYKNDYDRKPLPGMAYKAALGHRLNLPDSVMIGDMDSDKQFAENAGIGTFIFTKDYLPQTAQQHG